MNKLSLLLLSAALCGAVSCHSAGPPVNMCGSVNKTDSCKIDARNSYELYIPARADNGNKLPLLVVLDPHGSGKFALDKFRLSADRFPAVVVASNYIKNGSDTYESAIQLLIDDVQTKYPASKTVFIAGFSGGARMALSYAMSHNVSGLVLCGALAGPEQIDAVRCPVFSISGMDDFNFVETAQYLFQQQPMPRNLTIELTRASHVWPDSQILAHAIGFISLQAAGLAAGQAVTQYCKEQIGRIDSLRGSGDLLAASLAARNMSSAVLFRDKEAFADANNSIQSDSVYKALIVKLEKYIGIELRVRQPYIDAFQSKDSLWWRNEIEVTDQRIATEADPYGRDMYQRIKGFWGIACFSFCKQAVSAHNAQMLNQTLAIYRMLEPENPDMFYFAAASKWWGSDENAAVALLKKATNAGFSDIVQLKKDFPVSISSRF